MQWCFLNDVAASTLVGMKRNAQQQWGSQCYILHRCAATAHFLYNTLLPHVRQNIPF